MTFDERVDALKKIGFTETKTGMTNGTYSFLWHQIDISELTNKEFKQYYNHMTNKFVCQQDNN